MTTSNSLICLDFTTVSKLLNNDSGAGTSSIVRLIDCSDSSLFAVRPKNDLFSYDVLYSRNCELGSNADTRSTANCSVTIALKANFRAVYLINSS